MDPVLIGGGIALAVVVLLITLLVRQTKKAAAAESRLKDMEVAIGRKKKASTELGAHAQSVSDWLQDTPDT